MINFTIKKTIFFKNNQYGMMERNVEEGKKVERRRLRDTGKQKNRKIEIVRVRLKRKKGITLKQKVY